MYCLAADRTLAWSQLELCLVGTFQFSTDRSGKEILWKFFEFQTGNRTFLYHSFHSVILASIWNFRHDTAWIIFNENVPVPAPKLRHCI